MAQLRDLLVTGAARFVNGAYFGGASTFGSVTQPIWWNNGFPQATTYSLSATLNAGSANRLAYYSGTNVVSPSAHYASATQLGINITNASTIGSRSLYVNGASYYYDTMEARTGASHLGLKLGSTYLNAIDGDIIFQNNSAIRFGGDSWDYNVWAGLKYVHSNKKIVLGLADGTEFTANAAQSGGTFKIVGMSTVDMNKTASITNLAIGGGIYWNPYVESAGDWTDAASITVIAGGAAGGTELRIQQQNDANDIINLVASKWIYLNGKRAFTINDAWLRINEDNLFTEGIYTGQSIVRTDAQFQVGDSGSKFYANSSGNGYFSNTLGIAGTNTSYNLYINGTSRFNNTLYFFNSTGDTALSIESRRSKNSSNANIETITGLVTKNKSFIEIRGFAPPTMARATGDRPAPYGLGFGNGAESAGIMPIGEGDNLRELMFYGANSGPTLFTWKYQTWENTSYDSDASNGYSAAMMSLNSKTGDLYVKHSIGINGTNVAYKLYVNGTSYFNGVLFAKYDVDMISHENEFNVVPTLSDNMIFYFNYRQTNGNNTNGYKITQYNFCDGNGATLASITNGKFNGTATAANYTTQLLGVNASNTPYGVSEGNLIRAVWNVKNDNRWYFKAGSYECRVDYANSAINADTVDGYHADAFVKKSGDTMTGNLRFSDANGIYTRHIDGENVTFAGDLYLNYNVNAPIHVGHGGAYTISADGSYYSGNAATATGSNALRESQQNKVVMTTFLDNNANIHRSNLQGELNLYRFSAQGDEANYSATYGYPAVDNHTLVFSIDGGNAWERVIDLDIRSTNIYTRAKTNGTWGSWKRIWVEGNSVTSAVWNDYAECRKSDSQEPGYVMFEKGDDSLSKTIERLQHFAGIVSDTWGFSQGETADAKTNIAVAGRVLAYPYRDRNEYKPGDCVCAAPGGKVDIMTREEIAQYPDRIVGTVSCVPEYEEWGGGEGADRDPVKVNGRIWIKVK